MNEIELATEISDSESKSLHEIYKEQLDPEKPLMRELWHKLMNPDG